MFDFNRAPVTCVVSFIIILSTTFYASLVADNSLLMASDKLMIVVDPSSSSSSSSSVQMGHLNRPQPIDGSLGCPSPLIQKGQHIRSLFMPAFSLFSEDNTFLAWLDSVLSLGTGHHRRRDGEHGCRQVSSTSQIKHPPSHFRTVWNFVWATSMTIFRGLFALIVVYPFRFAWSCTIALTPAELLLSLVLLLGSGAALEVRLGSLRFCSLLILLGFSGGILYLATIGTLSIAAHVIVSLDGANHNPEECGGAGGSNPMATMFLNTIGFPSHSSSHLLWLCAQATRAVVDLSSLVEVYVASCGQSQMFTSHWTLVPAVAPLALILHIINRLLTVTVAVVRTPKKRQGGYRSAATKINRKRQEHVPNGSSTSSSNNNSIQHCHEAGSSGSRLSRRSSPCVAVSAARMVSESTASRGSENTNSQTASTSADSGSSEATILLQAKFRVFYTGAVRVYKLLGFIPLVDASIGSRHPLHLTTLEHKNSENITTVPEPLAPSLPSQPSDSDVIPQRAVKAEDSDDSSSDDDDASYRPLYSLFGGASLSTTYVCDIIAIQLWVVSSAASTGWVTIASPTSQALSNPTSSFTELLQYLFLTMPISIAALPFSSRLLPVLWSTIIISHLLASSKFAKTVATVLDKAVTSRKVRLLRALQDDGEDILNGGRKRFGFWRRVKNLPRKVRSSFSAFGRYFQVTFKYIMSDTPKVETGDRLSTTVEMQGGPQLKALASLDAELRLSRVSNCTSSQYLTHQQHTKQYVAYKFESVALHQLPEDLFVSLWLRAQKLYWKAEKRRMERVMRRKWQQWQQQNKLRLSQGTCTSGCIPTSTSPITLGRRRTSSERREARRARQRLLSELETIWWNRFHENWISWVLYAILRVLMVPNTATTPADHQRLRREGRPSQTEASGNRESSSSPSSPASFNRFEQTYRLRPILETSVSADFLGPIRRVAAAVLSWHSRLGSNLVEYEAAIITRNAQLHREYEQLQEDLAEGGEAPTDSDTDVDDADCVTLDAYSDCDDENIGTSSGSRAAAAARIARGDPQPPRAAPRDPGLQVPSAEPSVLRQRIHPLKDLLRYYRHRPEFVTVTFVDDSLIQTTSQQPLHHTQAQRDFVGPYDASSTAPHVSSPADTNFTPPLGPDTASLGSRPVPTLYRSVSEEGSLDLSTSTATSTPQYHHREGTPTASSEPVLAANVQALLALGIEESSAREALRRGGGSVEGAVAILFGS